jgi:ABC-type antimicrobial peptide transport system permease subunit
MDRLGLFVAGLGLLAVFLSSMGIHGVMAHSVVQERREIGIPLAVGARAGQLVGLVTKKGLVLGYGIAHTAGGILVGVTILASYVPARGAARVHPTRALSLD